MVGFRGADPKHATLPVASSPPLLTLLIALHPLTRGITDVKATGQFLAKGSQGPPVTKNVWDLAVSAELVGKKEKPWYALLTEAGVTPTGAVSKFRPCVWRRLGTGPIADQIGKDSRWDWRSAPCERRVRLIMQSRDVAPTSEARASAG